MGAHLIIESDVMKLTLARVQLHLSSGMLLKLTWRHGTFLPDVRSLNDNKSHVLFKKLLTEGVSWDCGYYETV